MRSRRRPERRRGGWRFAVAGLAVTVVLIPGVARADGTGNGTTTPPAPTGLGAVTSLLPGGTDPLPGGDPTGLLSGSGGQQSGTPAGGNTDTNTPSADTPAPSLPPQLQDLLDKLKSLQPPSSECSTAIQADLTKLLTDVPTLIQAIVTDLLDQLTSGQPPNPQDLLDQLQGLLGQLQGHQAATAAGASATPDPTVILADLQQLVTDLTTKCLPAPPTTTPPASTTPPPPVNQPQPQPAQPVAQPVSYPGYAATGSIAPAAAEHPVDTGPLAALGGGVLLVSGAATAAVRFRGRRAGR